MTLDTAYRKRLAKLRDASATKVAAEFGTRVKADAIAASYEDFIKWAAIITEAGQAQAQTLSAAYLERLAGAIVDEDEDIVGTTRAGKTIAEGLAPFGSMILAAIANGSDVPAALDFGRTLVGGFADREVTAAADRETEHQVAAAPQAWQWEGIVQPGSCDPCLDNEGLHDADEDIYRHNDCNCDRRWVPAA